MVEYYHMQDKYRPTPESAAEFRSRPNGWDEFPLTPEIDISEKRFSAVLNVLKNGGQTLTVLTMPPYREMWTDYRTISSNMNQQVGLPVVKADIATKDHLTYCIEPIGAAARSTLDDKEWSLTPFGIAMRPALIFAWQRLLVQGFDGTEVFGTNSQRKKGQEEDLPTTAPLTRARALLLIRERGVVQEVDLMRKTGLTSATITRHTNRLHELGIIHKESRSTQDGEPTTIYEVISNEDLSAWPPYQTLNDKTHLGKGEMVKKAIDMLRINGEPITRSSVSDILVKEQKITPVSALWSAGSMLSFYTKKGVMKKNREHPSEITLTQNGQKIVDKILTPLDSWSKDRWVIEEINTIGRRIASNRHAYNDLLKKIADSYITHSPYKNMDPEGKTSELLRLIRENPGSITQSDLVRHTGMSLTKVHVALGELLKTGHVVGIKAKTGQRVFLSPRDTNKT